MVKMALAVPQKNLGFTDNAKLANQMTRVILPPAFFSTAPRTKKNMTSQSLGFAGLVWRYPQEFPARTNTLSNIRT